jgi:mannose-6-phosphate isomerase-like protein (cupin superfamily)
MKRTLSLLALLAFVGAGCATSSRPAAPNAFIPPSVIPMSYQGNVIKETKENENFRRVVFTGPNSQLVVMSIPPGGEVGEETHHYTEQTLFFLSGTGEGTLGDRKFPIAPGDAVVVTAGTKHNFRNTGTEPLKIYTVYAPPNHIDGRVHATKADADADAEDEAIGETAPSR